MKSIVKNRGRLTAQQCVVFIVFAAFVLSLFRISSLARMSGTARHCEHVLLYLIVTFGD